MKTIDINDVKAKFDTYSDASRITFSATSGEPVVWVKTRDGEEGFVTESDAVDMAHADIVLFSRCYDCFDDIFGESEEEWEACANGKLHRCGVELGAYHDDGEYYDLLSI